ncbi:MAG: hypothetical protein QOD75_3548 [Blastocatellia bacterium]|jgi:uncharacterized protein (DUF433 family)|nr:hypothetical protein [Blastocatellia bacterium]
MKLEHLIERDPRQMSGIPVFCGTRVPIKHLFDYLETGDSLETFLNDFPTVSREHAIAVLSASRESLMNEKTSAAARLEVMKEATNDEMFMADLRATMEDFREADKLNHLI